MNPDAESGDNPIEHGEASQPTPPNLDYVAVTFIIFSSLLMPFVIAAAETYVHHLLLVLTLM